MVSMLLFPVLFCTAGHEDRPVPADPFQATLVAALHHFAEEGELEHVRAILDRYPKLVDAKQVFQQPRKWLLKDHYTALQTAAKNGWENVVAILIEKGADVNIADGFGYTALHLAAERGRLEVVKQLVKAGAKINAKTRAFPEGIVAPGPGPDTLPSKPKPIPARTALQIAQDRKFTNVVEYLKTVK